MRSRFLVGLVFFFVSSFAFAGKSPFYNHWYKGALKGVDVVAYYDIEAGSKAVRGSDEFTYEYKGATWKFSTPENRDRFKAAPETFIPAYGGYCAFSVAKNFVVSPRVDSWKKVDGKIYLNNNKNSFKLWQENQSDMITNADANWPAVLSKQINQAK